MALAGPGPGLAEGSLSAREACLLPGERHELPGSYRLEGLFLVGCDTARHFTGDTGHQAFRVKGLQVHVTCHVG